MQGSDPKTAIETSPTKGTSRKNASESGFALAITLLSVAAFLYLSPNYLASEIITRITGLLLAIVGTGGLGFELSRLSGRGRTFGFDNLGLGLGFIGIWAIIYHFSPGWFINAPILLLLLFGLYGTTLGIIELLKSLPFNQPVQSQAPTAIELFTRGFVAIATLAGLVLTLLQIAKILKIIP